IQTRLGNRGVHRSLHAEARTMAVRGYGSSDPGGGVVFLRNRTRWPENSRYTGLYRIDFIAAYCDRWCERCAYTMRCSAYACRVAIAVTPARRLSPTRPDTFSGGCFKN